MATAAKQEAWNATAARGRFSVPRTRAGRAGGVRRARTPPRATADIPAPMAKATTNHQGIPGEQGLNSERFVVGIPDGGCSRHTIDQQGIDHTGNNRLEKELRPARR